MEVSSLTIIEPSTKVPVIWPYIYLAVFKFFSTKVGYSFSLIFVKWEQDYRQWD
jgi:hypothetical protein